MRSPLSVVCSRIGFSYLMYENTKSEFTQEGFLLGEIIENETVRVTDNNPHQVDISRVIRINGALPCPQVCYFYDGAGRLDTEKIKNFIGDLNVIAWYKFKQNSEVTNFTHRELLIHLQLSELLKVPLDQFTCGLLTSETNKNKSTHSYKQNFVRFMGSCESIPMKIENLTENNNMYKNPKKLSNVVLSAIKGINFDSSRTPNVMINEVQATIRTKTNQLVQELCQAELELSKLEKEFNEMTEKSRLLPETLKNGTD